MPNRPKSLPVLSGRLRNRRERIKENVVSYAIARTGDQTIVSDVSSPPEDPSNLEKTKQWLNNFVDYVNTGSQVAQGTKLLAPTAKELIPAVAALL